MICTPVNDKKDNSQMEAPIKIPSGLYFSMWDSISYKSRTPLVFIKGAMAAQLYIADMLQPVVLLFIEQTNNANFQQANALPHIASITRAFH
ncbi:hypothetical protein LAZ67_6002584 [Cordylochernes scorpioides]|uniref:Uncharacterized protein n=1 Tax=Cordylochernes scorpioides TaxID=51811 RepID=A0ABY6KKY3_9ARAC|nr:hypothetical protein LAZ67_6002584 [Cordylochernes scorpioides]